jgi:hypothetical protein
MPFDRGVSTVSHVFISYSRQDRSYARSLADRLLELGFDVWIDDRIDYGESWWDAIVSAIDRCTAFVVVMTSQSKDSSWVEREVLLALNQEKPIFPLLLKGRNWPIFVATQYIDMTDGKLPRLAFFDQLSRYAPPKQIYGYNVAVEPITSASLTSHTEVIEPKSETTSVGVISTQNLRPAWPVAGFSIGAAMGFLLFIDSASGLGLAIAVGLIFGLMGIGIGYLMSMFGFTRGSKIGLILGGTLGLAMGLPTSSYQQSASFNYRLSFFIFTLTVLGAIGWLIGRSISAFAGLIGRLVKR